MLFWSHAGAGTVQAEIATTKSAIIKGSMVFLLITFIRHILFQKKPIVSLYQRVLQCYLPSMCEDGERKEK